MKRQILILAAWFVTGCFLAARVDAHDGIANAFGVAAPKTVSETTMTPEMFDDLIKNTPCKELKKIGKAAYSLEVEYSGYSFPALAYTNDSGTVVFACYNLSPIPESAKAEEYAPKLLTLLSKNGDFGESFICYDHKHRMLQVWTRIEMNKPLSTEDFANRLIRMGDMAIATQEQWNPALWNKNLPRHVGTWESRSPAMTLALKEGDRFELETSGNTMTGNFTIDGDLLELVDSTGETLSVGIRFEDANTFVITADGKEIRFVRN